MQNPTNLHLRTPIAFIRNQGFWLLHTEGANFAGFVSYIPPLNGRRYRPDENPSKSHLLIQRFGTWE